jgi:exopolysaccharide biosynthesis protein
MKDLGAYQALAMDGGGSARLTWRDGNEIHSFPADRFYRAVPNRLLLAR